MAVEDVYPVSWIVLCYMMACCNFLAFASSLFTFQALIRNFSIRQNAYNIYVIFLIFPDCLQNLMVGLWNSFLYRLPQGYYETNIFLWFFYFVSNFYLNAVLAYEINILATASYNRQRTSPPKLYRAWKQVTAVYIFAIIPSLWVILPYKWSPMDIYDGPNRGVKVGSPNDGVFGPLAVYLMNFGVIGIPIIYVLYIRRRISRRKLLPKRGRTRVLSLYFMRIIIVFLLFYLPNTILVSFLDNLVDHPVPYFWIGRVITPLLNACQAYATLYMVMSKEDIRKAVASSWNQSFGKCCCHMATSTPQRASAAPLRFKPSRPCGDLNVNNNPSYPIPSSSLSISHITESTLPQNNEWNEDDLYDDSERAGVEGGCDDIPEDHSSVGWDEESSGHPLEEKASNCRDCTDAWVEGQTSIAMDASSSSSS